MEIMKAVLVVVVQPDGWMCTHKTLDVHSWFHMDRKEKLKCKLASSGAHMMKRTDWPVFIIQCKWIKHIDYIFKSSRRCSNGKNIYTTAVSKLLKTAAACNGHGRSKSSPIFTPPNNKPQTDGSKKKKKRIRYTRTYSHMGQF